MKDIKVYFTTTQGYTVTGNFKREDSQEIVRMIKRSMSNNQAIYIGNGVYVQPQHIFAFRIMQE